MVYLSRLKRIRSTIFVKLMLTFILVLAPLYLLTLFINDSGANSIRKEISQSIANRNDFYLKTLELEVERILQILPEYVVDKDLMALSTTGNSITDYEKVESIMQIQKRINLIKYNSSYIQEVRAYIPLLQRTILTEDFETSVNEAEFNALQLRNNRYKSPLIYWNGRLFISTQYPAISTRIPVFEIGVELSIKKLKMTLEEMISIPYGNAELLDLNREWSLSNEVDSSIPDTLHSYIVEQKQQGLLAGYDTLLIKNNRYLVSYKYSSILDCYLVSYVPEGYITGPINKYQYWILGISILSLFIVLFFSMSIFRIIHRPLRGLTSAFKRMQIGDIRPVANVIRQDEFGYLYQAYNETAIHLKTLIRENYEQKIYSQRSELKRLQSQINPHFLYNCFFVLCRLIKSEDLELAYRFCLYVGDYFQFITRDDADEIPLEVEIKHARTYVDIQKVCYGERIQIEFETLDLSLEKKRVPRLILQPIVENIYKHAVSKMLTGGTLRIHMEHIGNDLTIYMEDSGDSLTDLDLKQLNQKLSLSENQIEDTTGLINVHRRIQIRYGSDYGLRMSRSSLGGLRVAIKLLIIEGDD